MQALNHPYSPYSLPTPPSGYGNGPWGQTLTDYIKRCEDTMRRNHAQDEAYVAYLRAVQIGEG